ncbi:MAG: phosphatase PAP2 family protein [Treponema sp.]|jgi:membrane-associated phospholipid phosphatase|nr:phosphatase PAP2 family protein [Treponema sp.]
MNEGIINILPADGTKFLSLYGVYRWGIEFIKAIQVIKNPVLTGLMKFLTALGTEYVYILVVLFVFWCVDKKKGFRLGTLVILSAWVNDVLKFFFKQPRPYNLDPAVGLAFESSYGIPSGHAQLSLVFWFLLASWYRGRRKGAVRIAALFFTLVIGFTRLYLGVHFPTDLLAGWLLGGIILALYFVLEAPLTAIFTVGFPGMVSGGTRLRMICVALIALGMNTLHPQDTRLGGLFLGFGLGYNLMLKYLPFSGGPETGGKKNSPLVFGLRYFLGLIGAAVFYLGSRILLPGESSLWAESPRWGIMSPYYELGRFLGYGLLGLWATLGAVWVFTQIDQKIADR